MQTGSGTGYQAQVTQTVDVCYRGSPKTLVWETGPLSKEPHQIIFREAVPQTPNVSVRGMDSPPPGPNVLAVI